MFFKKRCAYFGGGHRGPRAPLEVGDALVDLPGFVCKLLMHATDSVGHRRLARTSGHVNAFELVAHALLRVGDAGVDLLGLIDKLELRELGELPPTVHGQPASQFYFPTPFSLSFPLSYPLHFLT